MKKLIYLVSLVITNTLLAQIVVLHPVKVPAAQIDHFENIELNYSKKNSSTCSQQWEFRILGLNESF
jgi:hypothetical protein